MRQIKLNGVVSTIDISDGKGSLPFGMNGVGGMKAVVDSRVISDNCYFENERMLDGEVNFKQETETHNFSYYYKFLIDDERYEKLKAIHRLDYQQCKGLPIEDRVQTVLFGLKYFPINYINGGYQFGKELTYRDFCITFNSEKLVVYKSSHNSYIAPDYLLLEQGQEYFDAVYSAIKSSIDDYFGVSSNNQS